MNWLMTIQTRFRALFQKRKLDAEMNDEMRSHIEMRTQANIESGMNPEAARFAALRQFGWTESIKETCREQRGVTWLENLAQDIRYGARQLRKNPGFAAVAALTLALGIGANAAIFGVLKSVLLDALPYADADQLVRLYSRMLDGSQERGPLSAGAIEDIANRQRSFDGLSAFMHHTTDAVYGGDERPQNTTIGWVEPSFFQTLGVAAAHGRTFSPDAGTSGLVPLSGSQLSPDTARVVVLANAAWQRLFHGNPGIIGRDVRIGGILRTVIGVLPRDFVGPMGEADFYFAFDLGPVTAHPFAARKSQWLGLVGRLKPGITQDAVQRELSAIGSDLAREHPKDDGPFGMMAEPLRDAMVGDTRTPLLVLMGGAGLVLLITCANLAGVLLSRSLSRRKEFAIRVALGARRGRLVRQLLTESTVLALVGGVAGLLLAVLMLALLRGFALPALPDYTRMSLDSGAVLVTAIGALFAGLAFGLVPAVSAGRTDPQGALCDHIRGASESLHSRHFPGALVAGQMALCLSLLAAAGLLSRSLWAMIREPLGFNPEGVLAVTVQLPSRDYPTPDAFARFHEQFTDRLRVLPGVDAVANATSVPTDVRSQVPFSIDGVPRQTDEGTPFALFASVSDEYFSTLRLPLKQGRAFDARDRFDSPPTVVISESMAHRFRSGSTAVGARIRIGSDPNSPLLEVIGIVSDVRNDRARKDTQPMLYRSSRQVPWPFANYLLRTRRDPVALASSVESQLAAMDTGLALQRVTTLRAILGERLAGRRLPVLLMSAFGTLALLVAAVGVYAMFASMAAAREREFGVRMALGSRPQAIAALVLRQGAGWMAAGLAGGALGVVLVVRLIRNLLYDVAPFDLVSLGIAAFLVIFVGTVAALIPAVRAARIDPIKAMRND